MIEGGSFDSEPLFTPILFEPLEMAEYSGGGQGKAPKPPTKIRGSQDRQRQEKVRNIPKVNWPKITNPFTKKK